MCIQKQPKHTRSRYVFCLPEAKRSVQSVFFVVYALYAVWIKHHVMSDTHVRKSIQALRTLLLSNRKE